MKTMIFNLVMITGCCLTFSSCEGFQADDALVSDNDSLDIVIPDEQRSYRIVDTRTIKFYNNQTEVSEPQPGEAFYGQDANIAGNQPSYRDNGDGTVSDLVTGLMWTKSPDLNGDGTINAEDKLTYDEAVEYAKEISAGGFSDWRLPTIKELYSLTNFSGVDPNPQLTSAAGLIPFIDTDYFEFGYGDLDTGDRIIDAQMATSTIYTGLTMGGNKTMFGYNFADGRIKGYPAGQLPNGNKKGYYVYFVRGNESYGKNNFEDNQDGTVSDLATGLMWTQDDSEDGMNWADALAWVQQKNDEEYLGYSDWRLPNIKELQSIVDYSRSPQATQSPAIDPVFNCTEIVDEGGAVNYGFYWSGTTHINMQGGGSACYIAFGEALGFLEMPPMSGMMNLDDVHGAGAQRSDPKMGDPADYPYGHGPQGDVIRIFNLVRMVRSMN